jgi:hypothetical protein
MAPLETALMSRKCSPSLYSNSTNVRHILTLIVLLLLLLFSRVETTGLSN